MWIIKESVYPTESAGDFFLGSQKRKKKKKNSERKRRIEEIMGYWAYNRRNR
jgi:hypothetical protein